MPLKKQAKILSRQQVEVISRCLASKRNGLRDQTIFLLSVKAGLRAKEIANLKWSMLMDAEGNLCDCINLTDSASKGKSGRSIPINRDLMSSLCALHMHESRGIKFDFADKFVVRTERSTRTSSQIIVNMFHRWYQELGLNGCSSHSGRRTFITNAARKISTVGGSLRDVQLLCGHSSLRTTQLYIESNRDAHRKIIDLV